MKERESTGGGPASGLRCFACPQLVSPVSARHRRRGMTEVEKDTAPDVSPGVSAVNVLYDYSVYLRTHTHTRHSKPRQGTHVMTRKSLVARVAPPSLCPPAPRPHPCIPQIRPPPVSPDCPCHDGPSAQYPARLRHCCHPGLPKHRARRRVPLSLHPRCPPQAEALAGWLPQVPHLQQPCHGLRPGPQLFRRHLLQGQR